MPTLSRSTPFLLTMLLGLVMAAGIYVLAQPELAWLGFAMAAILQAARSPRRCFTRAAGRTGA